jgi:cytochrome oxidase Cu insertion factor (SCO1/SenC/PrrC family)
MKKLLAALVMAGSLLSPAVNAAPKEAAAMPKVGDMAPDFKLQADNGKEVSLADFRGKKQVVLAFYIFAFTGG